MYVTGYSMGGGATCRSIYGNPKLFAAAIPMSAALYTGDDEQKAGFDGVELPLMLTTSTYDLGGAFSAATMQISGGYQNYLNDFLAYNGLTANEYDFETYPLVGFEGELYNEQTLNGEYLNMTWFRVREDGAPMVGVSYTQNLKHALYPEFAGLAWNWAKHFSRNQETGEIEYNPYVK